MLGQTISDPDGIEGSIPQLPGLGLLNISTVMTAEKTTKQVEFEFEGKKCKGYEIHQGKTEPCTIDHVQLLKRRDAKAQRKNLCDFAS